MTNIHSIHIFPIKGMQGFSQEKCLLQENKLLENDRRYALTQTAKVSNLTSWLPKSHFEQLVNQPSLAKIRLQLVKINPLVVRINNQDEAFDLTCLDRRQIFVKTVEKLSKPAKYISFNLVESMKGGLSDTRDQWVSIGGTASANKLIETFKLDRSIFRFRLNIWIKTEFPFEEFSWRGRIGKIGDVELEFLSPVGRCNAINLSAETGESTDKLLPQEMRAKFGHSNLGIFARVIKTGKVAVNDKLYFI